MKRKRHGQKEHEQKPEAGTAGKLIRDSRGSAYIFTCVLVLVIAAIGSMAIRYYSLINLTNKSKEMMEQKLDAFISLYSIEKMAVIRLGDGFDGEIDKAELVRGAYEALGSDRTAKSLELVFGETKLQIRNLVITARTGNRVGVEAEYEIVLPISLIGGGSITARIPVRVRSGLVSFE